MARPSSSKSLNKEMTSKWCTDNQTRRRRRITRLYWFSLFLFVRRGRRRFLTRCPKSGRSMMSHQLFPIRSAQTFSEKVPYDGVPTCRLSSHSRSRTIPNPTNTLGPRQRKKKNTTRNGTRLNLSSVIGILREVGVTPALDPQSRSQILRNFVSLNFPCASLYTSRFARPPFPKAAWPVDTENGGVGSLVRPDTIFDV